MERDLDEALNEALMLVSMVHDALSATETLVGTGDAEGCARELSGLLMCIARAAKEAQSAVEAAMASPNSCKAALVAA